MGDIKLHNRYKIKKYYKYIPNLITLTNMSIGLFVIYSIILNYSSDNNIKYAVLILISGIADFLDGKVARLLDVESSLGKELDSLADLISFGVAPTALFINEYTRYLGYIWMIICIFYTLMGALRLARYNIASSSNYFTGIPITFSAMLLSFKHVVAVRLNFYEKYPLPDLILTCVFIVILSYMMISKVKINKI